ncbi:hypothetical protein diail_2973 [Diaporthe ilicicola]|nr:hypothetical protein diail_2973 [Diaporthe ilicicola]
MEHQHLGLQGRLATFLRKVEYRFPGAPDKSQIIRSEVLNPITNGLKEPKDCLSIVRTCLRTAKELIRDFEDIANTYGGDATNHPQRSAPAENSLLRSNQASSVLQSDSDTNAASQQQQQQQQQQQLIQSESRLIDSRPSSSSSVPQLPSRADVANRQQQSTQSGDRLPSSRPTTASSAFQLHSRVNSDGFQIGEPQVGVYVPPRRVPQGGVREPRAIQWAEADARLSRLGLCLKPIARSADPPQVSTSDANQSTDTQNCQDDGHRNDNQNLLVLSEVDIPPHQRKQTPKQMSCALTGHQRIGLTWLIDQEMDRKKRGGLLADTMGLGKTVQALSLILAHKSADPKRKATLIVAPLALLRQWEQEISNKVKPPYKLRTMVFHGPGCKSVTVSQLLDHDIVLCTYGKLETEYKNKYELKQPEKLRILAKKASFYRVILDEAHNIRNQSTYASKAAVEIQSIYRLCMTGTPFMNRAEEIFALIRFLNISPYNKWERFSQDIVRPLRNWDGDEKERGMIKLQALFRSFTLRRTKDSRLDGKPVIELPPRFDKPAFVEFNDEQRAFYRALEVQQQLTFNKYLMNGAVMKNYMHILMLLLRLRQACDHPFLLKDSAIPEGAKLDEKQMIKLACKLPSHVVDKLRQQKQFECLICSASTENPLVVHPCGHHICANCFTASMAIEEPEKLGDDRADNGDKSGEKRAVPCPGEQCEHSITPKNIVCYIFLNDVPNSDPFDPDNDGLGEDLASYNGSDDDIAMDGSLPRFDSEFDAEAFNDLDSSFDEEDFHDGNENGEWDDIEGEIDESEQMAYVGESGYSQMDGADDEPVSRTPKRKSSAEKPGAHGRKRSRTVTNALGGSSKGKDRSKKKNSLSLADRRVAAHRSAVALSRYKKRLRKEWISSAKIDAIMEILEQIRRKGEKTLIFSFWPSFLDLVEIPIERAKIKFTRYDGSMTPSARVAAVKSFMEDPAVRVMLVSLTAGNAGLNLTAASQVIVTEPFWNPFVEEQAIDRAHRFGQTRPVTVHRLLIAGTVEDRILKLQERKKMLVDAALSEKGAESVSKLDVAELRNLFGV